MSILIRWLKTTTQIVDFSITQLSAAVLLKPTGTHITQLSAAVLLKPTIT